MQVSPHQRGFFLQWTVGTTDAHNWSKCRECVSGTLSHNGPSVSHRLHKVHRLLRKRGGGKIGSTREQGEWGLLGTAGLGIHEPTTAVVA